MSGGGGFETFCGSELWNWDLTWNTDDPRFTDCFERTVLVWLPCGYLWLLAALQGRWLMQSKDRHIPWTLLNVFKLLCSSALIATQVQELRQRVGETAVPPNDVLCPLLLSASILLQSVFIVLEKQRGSQSSAYLSVFWVLMVACGAPRYRTCYSGVVHPGSTDSLYTTYYPLTVVMLGLCFFADARPRNLHHARGPNACPEQDSCFFSRLTFQWLQPLIRRGYHQPLQQQDMWDLSAENTARKVVRVWTDNYNKEAKRQACLTSPANSDSGQKTAPNKRDPKPRVSILPTMIRTFGMQFLGGTVLKVIYDVLAFASPQILSILIAFTDDATTEDWKGYYYVWLMFLAALGQSLLLGQYSVKMYLVGQRMRTGIITTVYNKALRISSAARRRTTVGEIVNLMSVDAQRLMDLMAYLNMLVTAPVTILVAIYFLWQQVGPSALVGLLVLIVTLPVNSIISNQNKTLHIQQMKYKDERIKTINDMLGGMKVLKLNAWEPSFEKQILDIRKKEILYIKKIGYWNSLMSLISVITPFVVMFVTFFTYVLVDSSHQLTSEKIFVSIALMNIIRIPLYVVPFLVMTSVQSKVSVQRLDRFLNAEEIDPEAVTRSSCEGYDMSIVNGTFAWGDAAEDEAILKDLNLSIKKGSLVAVVGTVGAGKSSLCSALLGDMEKRAGTVSVASKIAYMPQQAWIQNCTLKDNILFGSSCDDVRYHRVLEACALTEDLKNLPAGDMTEIGEKGINLSGGQKQRISLARAVYSDFDICVLDDPLSAVDAHVGKHIFDNVIGPNGVLKRKTRLLVTHAITYLPSMDHIIVMKDGRISEQGSYQHLLTNGGQFQDFLLQHLVEEALDGGDTQETTEIKRQLEQVIETETLERQLSLKRQESETRRDNRDDGSSGSSGNSGLRYRGKKDGGRAVGSTGSQEGARTGEPVSRVSPSGVDKLIEKETTQTGKIKWEVYSYYLLSMGRPIIVLLILSSTASQLCTVASNLWLTRWSQDNNSTEITARNKYLGIYCMLGVGQAVFTLLTGVFLARGTVLAGWQLNRDMLSNILRSPMSFFDVTPAGRIVNRFSKDMDSIDTLLPMNISYVLQQGFWCVGVFLVIAYSTPLFTVVLVPCVAIYYAVQVVFIRTSRQLKRIESVAVSPIYSHFGESVQGAATIRAYGRQEAFMRETETRVDFNQRSYFLNIVSNKWLSIRLDLLGNLLAVAVALFAVGARGSVSPGIVGLTLSYAQSVTMVLYMTVRFVSEMETNIVAVERVQQYTRTPQEAPWEGPDGPPHQDWPAKGVIQFSNYSARYRPGLDLVLKGVDCTIQGGEKVGVVGRTGAGKSSLTLGLLRIIEAASGHIFIDGVDIASIGLHDLRGRITVIPQDPVLFTGTLRFNLDPFEVHSDAVVWSALQQAHLRSYVETLPQKLTTEVSEGGENFSVGQRQLVCLARALLRRTRVLVLDEATAAVDLETDELIQTTIRDQFSACTIVTIAHRLNTIMGYDKILVLDKGMVKEFDSPTTLLKNVDSIFYRMAKDSGIA